MHGQTVTQTTPAAIAATLAGADASAAAGSGDLFSMLFAATGGQTAEQLSTNVGSVSLVPEPTATEFLPTTEDAERNGAESASAIAALLAQQQTTDVAGASLIPVASSDDITPESTLAEEDLLPNTASTLDESGLELPETLQRPAVFDAQQQEFAVEPPEDRVSAATTDQSTVTADELLPHEQNVDDDVAETFVTDVFAENVETVAAGNVENVLPNAVGAESTDPPNDSVAITELLAVINGDISANPALTSDAVEAAGQRDQLAAAYTVIALPDSPVPQVQDGAVVQSLHSATVVKSLGAPQFLSGATGDRNLAPSQGAGRQEVPLPTLPLPVVQQLTTAEVPVNPAHAAPVRPEQLQPVRQPVESRPLAELLATISPQSAEVAPAAVSDGAAPVPRGAARQTRPQTVPVAQTLTADPAPRQTGALTDLPRIASPPPPATLGAVTTSVGAATSPLTPAQQLQNITANESLPALEVDAVIERSTFSGQQSEPQISVGTFVAQDTVFSETTASAAPATSVPLTTQLLTSLAQTLSTVTTSEPEQLTLRLDPPELGELEVQFRSTDDGIHVRVGAREGVTMEMLLARSHEIERLLRGQDLDISKLEIVRDDEQRNTGANSDAEAGGREQQQHWRESLESRQRPATLPMSREPESPSSAGAARRIRA